MLRVTPSWTIDESELDEQFVRSSGPGGQNVNKVATAVQLRFDAARAVALSEEDRTRLRALAGGRMTGEGVIVIDARRFRTQSQNREDARERLVQLLRQALVKPRRRRKTKPTRQAVERRIDTKRKRSETKRARGRIEEDR